jgi:hypothetical protein
MRFPQYCTMDRRCKRQRTLALFAVVAQLASRVEAHLGPQGARHPAHQARHAQLKRDFLPHDKASKASSEATSLPVVASGADLSQGRYGHSAAYVASHDQVLFIGGQLGESGNYVTNDIVALDLTKPYPCSTNPSPQPALAAGLPPHAWAASAVDDRDHVWIIGGVTQDCSADPLALVLDVKRSTWTPADALPVAPPRRRQAQAIAVESPSGNKTSEIHVWGGIAEPFTCSPTTVGYMGLDIWGTSKGGNVTMRPYVAPAQAGPDFSPPVSDYAAVRLVLEQIVFLGGQTADGSLADLRQLVVYHTLTDEWELKVRSASLSQAHCRRKAADHRRRRAKREDGTRRVCDQRHTASPPRRRRRRQHADRRGLAARCATDGALAVVGADDE